jgi:hypothetical protein
MLPHDKALALSAVETEQLRDLRSRLNRLTGLAPVVAAKSIAPLSKGFFDLCARTGLAFAGDDGARTLQARSSPSAWARAADTADIGELRLLVAGLNQLQRAEPARWTEVVAGGALQAVISRRLALGGREPAKESESA